MKRLICAAVLAVATTVGCFGQAKKPTLMVVPSDAWCTKNGYVKTYDNQGVADSYPDYWQALRENTDLQLVISKVGEMMSERGFPLKDLEATLRSIRTDAAEDGVTMSKETGDGLAESPLEALKRTAKADIILQLTWTVNKTGPKQSVTFTLRGLDAYTDKQVAAASGTGNPSFSAEVPVLLEEGVLAHIDNFNSQLQAHFDDLFANGREVKLTCRRWSGSDVDFESEFDGEELGFLIEGWGGDNTVQGRFSTAEASENRMVFEQVRIPVMAENGRAMDTRLWANGLRRYLKTNYGLDAKLDTKGLGEAIITIGGK